MPCCACRLFFKYSLVYIKDNKKVTLGVEGRNSDSEQAASENLEPYDHVICWGWARTTWKKKSFEPNRSHDHVELSLDSLPHSSHFSTLYHQQLAHSRKVKYFFSVILIVYILLMIFMNRLCQRRGNSNRGSRRRVLTHRCVFFFCFFLNVLYLLYPRIATTLSPDHHYVHNYLQPWWPLQGAWNATVLSHINPHSHHHVDVSTHDCHFRRWCMTNGGSRHVYVSSTGIDYAYYNDTGRNGSREWERAEKGVDKRTTHWHPVTSSRYTSATI